ncbi:MAG: FAD-dependent oxidoreductase, partial [Planctomycetes bacterium]|nr:FAD-dependent oxidoreductase [Planctomycetota bacterium]
CVEVCPTGCLTDKDAQPGDRERWLLPCKHSCPAGADVPGYIRRIAMRDFDGAAALIRETLPLANVLGHVCFHLCEYECRRSQVDDAIAICALKKFAMESASSVQLPEATKAPKSGKKVAIVGSGPAGLTAAHFLALKGYDVTVFEAAESPGGMPARAIPSYRLPQDVLEKDLDAIRRLGVDVKTGHRVDTGKAMVGLLDEGYHAVLIAVGLPHSKKIDLHGSELDGVYWGLDFLTEAKTGESIEFGSEIIVVGGGNVAVDVAMTALRLANPAGATSPPTVRMFCLESREEMPAHAAEIEKAEAEGIEINPSWGPAAILGDQGKVDGIEFRRCTAVFDEQRKFAPTFDEQQRTTVHANVVILAVGQSPPDDYPAEQDGLFLAGDVTGGQLSIVHAVASGRTAAERIDKHLGGNGNVLVQLCDHPAPSARIGREESFIPRRRVAVNCRAPAERIAGFDEIEGTYSSEQAVAEAQRCLQCDLRLMLDLPTMPPERWLEFNSANVERAPAIDGVFVLANAEKKPVEIKGTADIRAGLVERLDGGAEASFFLWEEDRMYTKRESELIQQHLSQYGELPGGGADELDDLF